MDVCRHRKPILVEHPMWAMVETHPQWARKLITWPSILGLSWKNHIVSGATEQVI